MAGWDPTSEVRPGYSLADTRPRCCRAFCPKTRGLDGPGDSFFFPSRSSLSLGDLAPFPDTKVTTWFSTIPDTRFPPQPCP